LDFITEQKLWVEGYKLIAGVDEAGRGPLAGPVVAAAVILQWTVDSVPTAFLGKQKVGLALCGQWPVKDINDSKKLTAKTRERLFEEINKNAYSVGVGIVDNEIIDKSNILEAALLAMRKAVFNLMDPPGYILIDGLQVPFPKGHCVPQQAVVRGDSKVISIAAASIIAKVTRDRIMGEYARKFPQYKFEVHKGYPTKEHIRILNELGPCPIHRRTFKPVKAVSSIQYPV